MQDQPIGTGPYSKKVLWMYFNRIGNCQKMSKGNTLEQKSHCYITEMKFDSHTEAHSEKQINSQSIWGMS